MTEDTYQSRAKLATRLAFVAAGFGVACWALVRTFPAHELIEADANFTFEDFLSLKRFLHVSEREAPRD
jgi:hypothetical protein